VDIRFRTAHLHFYVDVTAAYEPWSIIAYSN